MRYKQKFLDDIVPLIKPEFLGVLNPVEDAAHTMQHLNECKYTLPSDFSTSEKDTIFLFEKKLRDATDDSNEKVEDYFYIGKEGALDE